MIPSTWFMHIISGMTKWRELTLDEVLNMHPSISTIVCDSQALADTMEGLSYVHGREINVVVGQYPYDDNHSRAVHIYPYDPRLLTVDLMSSV